MAFHFTGHGIRNTPENFGQRYKLQTQEGNFLLFEKEDGEGELLSENSLRDLI